jgi:hypothetical protein
MATSPTSTARVNEVIRRTIALSAAATSLFVERIAASCWPGGELVIRSDNGRFSRREAIPARREIELGSILGAHGLDQAAILKPSQSYVTVDRRRQLLAAGVDV